MERMVKLDKGFGEKGGCTLRNGYHRIQGTEVEKKSDRCGFLIDGFRS